MNTELDLTRQARRIEAVETEECFLENKAITFVDCDASDTGSEFRIEVARVTNGGFMNTPYAADDYYSFAATLSEDASLALLVSITQTKSSGASDSTDERLFLSLDRGRSWKNYSQNELKIITGHLEFKPLCEITG